MKIWVTRPSEDAAELSARLVAQGHDVFIEPLLDIVHDGNAPVDLAGAQGLIATSRNGLRAFAKHADAIRAFDLPLYAVGKGTAAEARRIGFVHVVEGAATARDLLAAITAVSTPCQGHLIHLSGEHVAFDLAKELERIGYTVLRPILYRSIQAERLSEPLLIRFRAGQIEGVILLSPRTAEVYARLIATHQLLCCARKLIHFCLSSSVADELASLQLEHVAICRSPNIEEMLALTGSSTAK